MSYKIIHGHHAMGIIVHLDKLDMVQGDPQDFTGADPNYPELYPCVIWLDGEYELIEEEIK